MSHLSPGRTLNRDCYKISSFIAKGGFGITYLADEIGYFKQSGFNDEEYISARYPDKVVVKELYYNDYCQRDDATGLVRISNSEKKYEFEKLVNKQLDEGKTLRNLRHPNIIRTRDIFKENDTAYMVMDYVESDNLEEIIKKNGKLIKGKAIGYINQVLTAINYIHGNKILHLDITPSNILVKKDTDHIVLIDFGASLTYNTEDSVKNTTSKLITGMKRYYAPNEQSDIDNLKKFDATFDTYAIGATLYNILTGQNPPLSSMVSTGREKIIPPSVYNNEVNDFLDAIIIKAIAPKYYDRFDDAACFKKMIEKENEYLPALAALKAKISGKDYKDALKDIEEMEKEFLPTDSLAELKKNHQSGSQSTATENEFKFYVEKANNLYKQQEYSHAKREFEKAAILFSADTMIQDKIKQCEEKINEIESHKKSYDKPGHTEETVIITKDPVLPHKPGYIEPGVQTTGPKSIEESIITDPGVGKKANKDVEKYDERKWIIFAFIGVIIVCVAIGTCNNDSKEDYTPAASTDSSATFDANTAAAMADSAKVITDTMQITTTTAMDSSR